MILYIETNFIVAAAKGQDAHIASIREGHRHDLRIIVPSVCVMEALSVFDAERKARNRFGNDLRTQINEASRDTTSSNAASLVSALQEAHLANSALLNDIETRLVAALEWLSGMHPGRLGAEFIPLQPSSLRSMLGQTPPAMLNPTDALILQTIINHGRQGADPIKAMLTGNTNDFATPHVQTALRGAGIEHFFPNTEALLGWLRGHPDAAL
jgi:hypothetical protein